MRQPPPQSPRGIHLFLGPDRPRKLQRIQALERSLGIQPFDRHQVDAATTTAAALLALCRQQPATSPVRLIVVDQAHRLDSQGVQALLHHADTVAQVACVILLVESELSVRHALAPLMTRAGTGGARTDEAVTIEQFPGRDTPATKPFAFTDALGNRDVRGALLAAQEQLLAGKDPLELLGLVAWQLNRWVMAKRLCRLGYTGERISAVMGLRPWQVQRMQSDVAGRSLASLQALLARCWRVDVDAKSGRTIPQLAIEELVAEVCGETVTWLC